MIPVCQTKLLNVAVRLCAIALLCLWQSALACEPDHSITVEQERDGKDVLLVIRPVRVEEATMTITGDLKNMTSSQALPYTTDLPHTTAEGDRRLIVRFTPIDGHSPFHWEWHSDVNYGNLGGKPDPDYIYQLPFRHGETHRISQTYFGTISHQKGTNSEYAVDFSMEEGTPVCAAREGRVVGLRDDSNDGGPSVKYKGCANFVVIRHADGSYGTYAHLRNKGVLVKLGATVKAGDVIGLSGNTGFSSGPHLHFEVGTPIDGKQVQTYPFKCQTDSGVVSKLKYHKEYTN